MFVSGHLCSHLRNGYRKADVQHMCSKFLVAAAKVLNNETLMLPSLQVRPPSRSDARDGDVEKLVVGEYMDSHGLNGALQAIAVRHLLLAACI